MASFVVMESPERKAGTPEERIEVIRDGFSFLALLFPFFWLLWHRLWVEAILVLSAGAAAAVIGSWPQYEFMSSALAVLISIFVGLEGNNMRILRLRRRGWRETAVIEAGSRASAEMRHIIETHNTAPAVKPLRDETVTKSANRAITASTGPALGLLTLPGRR
jgi:hypothetical protein